MSGGLEAIFLKAKRAEQRGEEAEARRLLQEVLNKYPKNRTAIGGMARLDDLRAGTGGASQAGLDDMLRSYAIDDFATTVAKGVALVERFPQATEIWNLMGAAYIDLNDVINAERAFRKAVASDPNHAVAQQNLLLCFRRQGKADGAEQFYKSLIATNPDDIDARCKLAKFYLDLDRTDEALETCTAALDIDPDHVESRFRLGSAHLQAKNTGQAVENLLKAIALKPDHFDAVFHLGHALFATGDFKNASDVYHQATLVDPKSVSAQLRFADTLRMTGAIDMSHDAFVRAHELSPDSANIKAHLLYQKAIICDWATRHEFRDLPTTPPLGDGCISPFVALTFEDDGARQLARSHALARKMLAFDATMPTPAPSANGKIRIGYFSADFHEHATMHLMGGLLREHDRDRFEIRVYSFGGPSDVLEPRVAPYVDAIIDIRDMTDAQAVERARADNLDIAIDLKGYTTNTRMELFGRRLAPVQIAWLGYPGSVGGDFMDYMIADAIVVPEGSERFYSERIIRVPGSYQANDNRRAIGTCADDRASFGLPEDAFVFCSFNQNYKIGPREYDIWMRLLHQVEGSVLWLIRSNATAEANLRSEAEARGIDAARIVFADKLNHYDHLARHRHADLFLDTFAVNAHTTASDSLWSGLPLLTLAGEQFAARVAASLLAAIGLPELITTSEADYEAKALDLARSPAKLALLKARLAANRLHTPLFDTVRNARAIESAYAAAHERRIAGLVPDHIALD